MESKQIKVIGELVKLTREGSIKWMKYMGDPKGITRTERHADIHYTANYKGHFLCLYEYRSKEWISDEDWVWDSGRALELVDETGLPLEEFVTCSATNDLLKAVKHQTSGMDEFIDKVLDLPF